MATYNGEEYISEQLDSILNQTLKPKRIIVRDDGSTDKTVEILKNYTDSYPEILLIKDYLGNLGYVKNFESLCKYTKSEIVFFSDQDDVWLDKKAEIMLKFFENESNSAVFSNAYLVESDLRNKGLLLPQNFDAKKSLSNILYRNFVTGCTLAVRNKTLRSLLPFPYGIPHDYWIAANCALTQKIKYINTPLVMYRQHERNVIGINDVYITKKIKNLVNFRYAMKRKKFHEEKYWLLKEICNNGYVDNIDSSDFYLINAYERIYNNKANVTDFYKIYKLNGFINLIVGILDSITLHLKCEDKK